MYFMVKISSLTYPNTTNWVNFLFLVWFLTHCCLIILDGLFEFKITKRENMSRKTRVVIELGKNGLICSSSSYSSCDPISTGLNLAD